MSSFQDQVKQKMNQALDHYKQELKNLRTNRANPGMLDGVQVDVYGTSMRIKELASVTTPEARMILVTPFDPSTTGAIAKAIEKANFGIMPIVDGHHVRLSIPPMDEATRKEMVKIAKKKGEDTKITIREIRRKSNELAKSMKDKGEVTEDLEKKMSKQVQDLTDQSCKEVDQCFAAREKEILTV
jgi:ribosome recycling factor